MSNHRVLTFGDGTPFVPAGGWAALFAWLVDFLAFLVLFAIGAVVFLGIGDAMALADGALAIGVLVLLFVTPLVYGLWFGGGRCFGGLWTGTRLVRQRDGRRLGARGPWAMLTRTILFPLVLVAAIAGGGIIPGTPPHVSIDVRRTRDVQVNGYPLTPRT
ncbi:RDD family protein [Glycomyces sp. NPDC046736]|uniref:RDD family protein n=1 Tax=Glycomyces sp. NPDC046736 TaxID=3155615 RepID=UPI0033EE9EB5